MCHMEPQRPPTCSPQNGCDLSMRIHKYGISAYVYACVILFNVFDLFIYFFFVICYIILVPIVVYFNIYLCIYVSKDVFICVY